MYIFVKKALISQINHKYFLFKSSVILNQKISFKIGKKTKSKELGASKVYWLSLKYKKVAAFMHSLQINAHETVNTAYLSFGITDFGA